MIQAICWTLIHSCWQGLLLSIVAALALSLTQKRSAALRYNLLGGLLFLFLATTLFTFFHELQQAETGVSGKIAGALVIADVGSWLTRHAPIVVGCWSVIFTLKCLHMAISLAATQRLRQNGTRPAPDHWNAMLDRFRGQLQIKKSVRLLESVLVKVPMVAGYWKPVILIPMGLLTQLPPGEIHAMLLHELAHVRRNDFLVNILQRLAENIFFFNPGLLWISSLLRQEREFCCDDIALSRTQNKIQFVQALINFKEFDLRTAKMAHAFPAGKNQLLKRVARIAHNKNKALDPAEKLFVLGSLLAMLLFMGISFRYPARPEPARQQQILANTAQQTVSRNDHALPPDLIEQTREPAQRPVARRQPILAHFSEPTAAREIIRTDPVSIIVPVRAKMPVFPKYPLQEEQSSVEQSFSDKERFGMDKLRADRDRMQAARDRDQALRDKHQAEMDRMQAEQDRQQAERDRIQAEKDRQQADRDREQAERDRKQAERDRMQAENDRVRSTKA